MQFQPSEPHHHHHLHALTNGAGQAAVGLAAVGTILAVAAIPTFVVGPFIVSAFKPEWSYGRRLATSMAFSAIVGTATGLIRASKGDEKATAPAAPATPTDAAKAAAKANGWTSSPACIDARARRIAQATNCAPWYPSLPMR